MKNFCLMLVLCVAGLMMSSCTPTETWGQHNRRILNENALNMRMAVDDWDLIWLNERSSMLTNWHPNIE